MSEGELMQSCVMAVAAAILVLRLRPSSYCSFCCLFSLRNVISIKSNASCCSRPYRHPQVRPGPVAAAAHRAALTRHTYLSESHTSSGHHVRLPARSSSTISDRLLFTGLRCGFTAAPPFSHVSVGGHGGHGALWIPVRTRAAALNTL